MTDDDLLSYCATQLDLFTSIHALVDAKTSAIATATSATAANDRLNELLTKALDQRDAANASVASLTSANQLLATENDALKARIAELTAAPPIPPVVVTPPPAPKFTSKLANYLDANGKIALGVSNPSGGKTSFVSVTGKQPFVEHEYAKSGTEFKTKLATMSKSAVRIINFKPNGKMGAQTYAEIVAGLHDDEIDIAVAAAKADGGLILVTPLHEPEDDDKTGNSDASYAVAYRHIAEKFKAGAPNVEMVWNVMSFSNWIPRYDKLFGDLADVVTWIAGDPYSHKTTDTLSTFGSVKAFYAWAAKHGKPMIWNEWGIDSTCKANAPAMLSAAGLAEMRKAMPLLLIMCYWNQWLPPATDPAVDYRVSNFPAAFKAFAALPEFNGLALPK